MVVEHYCFHDSPRLLQGAFWMNLILNSLVNFFSFVKGILSDAYTATIPLILAIIALTAVIKDRVSEVITLALNISFDLEFSGFIMEFANVANTLVPLDHLVSLMIMLTATFIACSIIRLIVKLIPMIG